MTYHYTHIETSPWTGVACSVYALAHCSSFCCFILPDTCYSIQWWTDRVSQLGAVPLKEEKKKKYVKCEAAWKHRSLAIWAHLGLELITKLLWVLYLAGTCHINKLPCNLLKICFSSKNWWNTYSSLTAPHCVAAHRLKKKTKQTTNYAPKSVVINVIWSFFFPYLQKEPGSIHFYSWMTIDLTVRDEGNTLLSRLLSKKNQYKIWRQSEARFDWK